MRGHAPLLIDRRSDLLSGLEARRVAPLAFTREAVSVLLPRQSGGISASLLKRDGVSSHAHAHAHATWIVGARRVAIGGV